VTQGRITPREVLIRSSNIGALQVGMRLGRDGSRATSSTRGSACARGSGCRASARASAQAAVRDPDRGFLPYTGPSISIGYEIQATPAQVARAFLTLLSGRPRELRLYSKVDLDGRSLDVRPPTPAASATCPTRPSPGPCGRWPTSSATSRTRPVSRCSKSSRSSASDAA
jgi:hypothetical protein